MQHPTTFIIVLIPWWSLYDIDIVMLSKADNRIEHTFGFLHSTLPQTKRTGLKGRLQLICPFNFIVCKYKTCTSVNIKVLASTLEKWFGKIKPFHVHQA